MVTKHTAAVSGHTTVDPVQMPPASGIIQRDPEFIRLKEEDLVATATRIGNLATANLPALAGYGIAAADVAELNTLATRFGGLQTAPRQAVVDRKKEIEQLPPVASHLLTTLRRRLDRQMLIFKQPQPELYAGYLAARVIVDRGNPAKKKTTTPTPPP